MSSPFEYAWRLTKEFGSALNMLKLKIMKKLKGDGQGV